MQNTRKKPAVWNLTLPKWDVLYIIWTRFLRRIQIWNRFWCICSVASPMAVSVLGGRGEGSCTSLKYYVWYIILTGILRRIQIWNGKLVNFLFGPKNPQKEIQCGKFNLAKMGDSIYHLDCNFEENPDLKSVFEYLLCGICYGSISAGGRGG